MDKHEHDKKRNSAVVFVHCRHSLSSTPARGNSVAPFDLVPEDVTDLREFRDDGRSSSVGERDRDGEGDIDAWRLCRDPKIVGDPGLKLGPSAVSASDSVISSSICLAIEAAARR